MLWFDVGKMAISIELNKVAKDVRFNVDGLFFFVEYS